MFLRLVSIFIGVLFLAGAAQAEGLTLSGDSYWVAIASRQKLDDAIAIAQAYPQQKPRVVRATNGWYAVILGPYVATGMANFLSYYSGPPLPSDVALKRGTGYVETVWRPGDRDACAKVEDPLPSIDACTTIIYWASDSVSVGNLALAYSNRGAAYGNEGDWDRAIADEDRAIQLNPNDGYAYDNRGEAYNRKGDSARALADYKEAARLIPDSDPNRAVVLKNIAELGLTPAQTQPPPTTVVAPAPLSTPPTTTVTTTPSVVAGDGAKISVATRNEGGQDITIITVEGDLVFGDEKRFNDVAISPRNATVILISPGGNLMAGIEIGKTIHIKGFKTLVPDGAICASACALAWLGGRPRIVTPTAHIGFHAAYLTDKSVASSGNAQVGAYLNELNLSLDAINYMTEAQPAEMKWLTIADAKSIGLEVVTASP